MSAQNCSYEVLELIFQQLPKTSLVECATVCKVWNSPATRLLYKTIETSSSTTMKLLTCFSNQTSGTNVGTLVKKLDIFLEYGSTPLSEGEFFQLLSYIPYVKVIKMRTDSFEKYLDYLSNNRNNQDTLRYLEELTIAPYYGNAYSDNVMKTYFLVAYSFRNTLKILHLSRPRSTYEIGSQIGRSAVNFLNDFVHLTHLSIDNQWMTSTGGDSSLSLFYFLHSFPNLISLEYKSGFRIPSNSGFTTLINGQQESLFTHITTKPFNIERLKNFTLQLPNITEFDLKLVLSFIPIKSLETFILNLSDTLPGVWIQDKSDEVLEQLGMYLGIAKQISSLSLEDYETTEQALNSIIILSPTEVTSRYLQVTNSIIRNENPTHYHICIEVSDFRSQNLLVSDLQIEKKKGHLVFFYSLDISEFRMYILEDRIIEAMLPAPRTCQQSSFQAKLLNSVEIVLHDIASTDISGIIRLLESAVTTCSKLDFVSFLGYAPACRIQFGRSPDIFDWNNHYYTNCVDDYYEYYNSKPDIKKNVTITSRESLRYAILENCRNIQTTSLRSITDLLPNLKILKLFNCQLEQDENYNYTIDIRGVSHLNLLEFDIQFVGKDRHYIFVKVDTLEDNRELLCFRADVDNNLLLFGPTKYMDSHNYCLKFVHSSTIIIKCHQRLDKINIYTDRYSSSDVLCTIDL